MPETDATTTERSLKSRLLPPAALILSAIAVVLILRVSRPAPENDPPTSTPPIANSPGINRANEGVLSEGGLPLPAGKVTLADVPLKPLERMGFLALPFPFAARLAKERLVIFDTVTQKTVWTGPVSQARFVAEPIQGSPLLTDSQGKGNWTPQQNFSKPDILVLKTADGSAEIKNKQGRSLWAGQIPTTPTGQPRTTLGQTSGFQTKQTPHSLSMMVSGFILKGVDGDFTIADQTGKRLWEGKLPEQPVVLVRDERTFSYTTTFGSGNGVNLTSDIRFEIENGKVSIANSQNKPLGTRPIKLLKVIATHPVSKLRIDPRTLPFQGIIRADGPRLLVDGTVLLTYRDSAGQVFLETKAFRDKRGSGEVGTKMIKGGADLSDS